MASSRGSPASNLKTCWSAMLDRKLAAMAVISLQALMRHQNQRRMSTLPVPAPMAMRSFQAPSMSVWNQVTTQLATMRSRVAAWPART